MVDVSVGPGQAPDVRIVAKGRCHILVDKLLQVDAECIPISPDNYIGAYTPIPRNVSHRIFEADIGRIVKSCDTDLVSGGQCKPGGPGERFRK